MIASTLSFGGHDDLSGFLFSSFIPCIPLAHFFFLELHFLAFSSFNSCRWAQHSDDILSAHFLRQAMSIAVDELMYTHQKFDFNVVAIA